MKKTTLTLACLALLVAGCSDKDDTTTGEAMEPESAAVVEEVEVGTQPGSGVVVEEEEMTTESTGEGMATESGGEGMEEMDAGSEESSTESGTEKTAE